MRTLPLIVAMAAMLSCGDPETSNPTSGTTGTDSGSVPVSPTDTETSTSLNPLSDALDVDRMLGHLDALQGIADTHSGNRRMLTTGFSASADYVAQQLAGAGYAVRREAFSVSVYENDSVSFEQTEPIASAFTNNVDFFVNPFSGNGTVDAAVVPVDAVIPAGQYPNTSTAGCEASDFAGFPAGAIALIQRGTCAFATKYNNAVAATASAVIFFNEGQAARTAPLPAQVGTTALAAVPSIGIGYDLGAALATAKSPRVVLDVQGHVVSGTDENLFAETSGNANRVVMVGAHLDSVEAGPGINDNASGTAFVLELALTMAEQGHEPANQVRFSFWGAEESGLIGSAAWLTDPKTGYADTAKLSTLSAYLNFDMMASPNGARFVYDGDASVYGNYPYSAANAAIEDLFEGWFAAEGQATAPAPVLLASDSFWFVLNGVPTGGVFSGASSLKSKAQAATFGGTAGVAFDVCYHQGCDDRSNIDPVLFEELARGSAHVVESLASGAAAQIGRARSQTSGITGLMPVAPLGCHDHVAMPW